MQIALSMKERLNLITEMNQVSLLPALNKRYGHVALLAAASRIKASGIDCGYYTGHIAIQQAIINEDCCLDRLKEIIAAGVYARDLNKLILTIASHDDILSNYSTLTIQRTISLMDRDEKFLYFCLQFLEKHQEMTGEICKSTCLSLHNLYRDKQAIALEWLETMDAEKIDVLSLNCLGKPLVVYKEDFAPLCQILLVHRPLRQLLHYLEDNDIDVKWTMKQFQAIAKHGEDVLQHVQTIHNLLEKEPHSFLYFVKRWIENDCEFRDLATVMHRLKTSPATDNVQCFESRISYANMLMGDTVLKIPLENLSPHQEALIFYAISARKRRFLRLVEDNLETFQLITRLSWLFDELFFSNYINLNDITPDDLRFCAAMDQKKWALSDLTVQTYTWKEIRTLYKQPPVYLKLYNLLLDVSVDQRLLVIRQLIKHRALRELVEEASISRLGEMLHQKPLCAWMQEELGHIRCLTHAIASHLLSLPPSARRFVPEIQTAEHAVLLYKNEERMEGYDSWLAVLYDLRNVDIAFQNLANAFDFSDEFIREHSSDVVVFISRNGANIAWSYYQQCTSMSYQREALRRIVKAVLMGEYNTLKYYDEDLFRELAHPITPTIKSAWMRNLANNDGAITVEERDDFYSTMQVGEQPLQTCLSYKNGIHYECLLSCFDSSKKFLFLYRGENIVGRAMIRLTKGRFHDKGVDVYGKTSLRFVDVESDLSEGSEVEQLTLFLERPYIAHLSPEETMKAKRMLAEMAATKAGELGCLLILNTEYQDCCMDHVARTNYSMFIPRSKAGVQYLDSLSGKAVVSDEGSYRQGNFLLWSGEQSNVEEQEAVTDSLEGAETHTQMVRTMQSVRDQTDETYLVTPGTDSVPANEESNPYALTMEADGQYSMF